MRPNGSTRGLASWAPICWHPGLAAADAGNHPGGGGAPYAARRRQVPRTANGPNVLRGVACRARHLAKCEMAAPARFQFTPASVLRPAASRLESCRARHIVAAQRFPDTWE
jgi:hypothetical protein